MPAGGREEIECSLEDAAPLIQKNSDGKPAHTYTSIWGPFGDSEAVHFALKSQAWTNRLFGFRENRNYKACKALDLNHLSPPSNLTWRALCPYSGLLFELLPIPGIAYLF